MAVTHGADPWPTSLEIALGELHQGTPVHSLSIQADDESGPALFVIFNDQGNQRDGDAIESVWVTITRSQLLSRGGEGHGLAACRSRRTSRSSKELDPDSVQLDVLRVELADSIDRKALFAAMSALASIAPGVLWRRT
ncbi:MAG: hypothetical protein J0L92_28675 [Deltaproteobacteria bacterium]|nr:hypothetical protein [Deltaproteobacteria bacterium]